MAMETALGAKMKRGFVTGTIVEPNESDATYD